MAQFDAIYLPRPPRKAPPVSVRGPGLTQRKEGCYDVRDVRCRDHRGGEGINQGYL